MTGPYKRKFHQRYYDVVGANEVNQNGLQSTFSLTGIEAAAAISILNTGKALATSNMLAEEIFFGIWEKPNFHTKDTNEELTTWPVTGYNCMYKTYRVPAPPSPDRFRVSNIP